MVEKNRLGRVTVDKSGIVIGSGGDLAANTFNVEDQRGIRIGQTSKDEFESANNNKKPISYRPLPWSCKKVAIINMKGGVGKTTLSLNLAFYLSQIEKKRVLLLDLDPQANATIVGMSESELTKHKAGKKTMVDLFINCYKQYGPFPHTEQENIELKEYLHESYISDDKKSYLHIIPSDILLSSVLKGVNLGPFDLNRLIIDEAEKKYDYIIVDCAPTHSILTTLALNATGAVLIPVMSDSFGIYGVKLMNQVLEEHKYDYGNEIEIVGLVFTMWEPKKEHQLTFSTKIIKNWGKKFTFNIKIVKSDWYKIANGKRVPFSQSGAHSEPKQDFQNFVHEYLQRRWNYDD